MIADLPTSLLTLFVATTLLTLFFFYRATQRSGKVLAILAGWLILQAAVALTGFYTVTQTLPPRFALLVAPPLLLIAVLFLTENGRGFIDSLDPKWLTLLHSVRIPVELTLFWLFLRGQIPGIMTFEGRNLDILSGITAPLAAYFGFDRQVIDKKVLLLWNFICLALLVNIVSIAVLSLDTPFQQFGLDQPNRAVTCFPFVWLPCGVVPLVLFSHLATIRHLLRSQVRNPSPLLA